MYHFNCSAFIDRAMTRKALGLLASWSFLVGVSVAQAQALPDFTQLIEDQSPAVVKITTQGSLGGGETGQLPQGQQIPEIFREFFEQQRPEREFRSMGSGFIISDDGYVLTNNHVVAHADEIRVRLIDQQEFRAEVVGMDPRSDLALLKIEAEDLPTLTFAESDSLKVGEWVLAIGSPFGLDYSASVGIVSAIGRSIPGSGRDSYVPFIQSDVAINPGNSGGPLFNLKGEVVGINTQIFTRSGGSIGLSFAVPSELAREVVAQLKTSGRVERGWLGVVLQELDRDLAQALGLDRSRGALVSQVQPGSPAAKSDFQSGDIIVEYDGTEINSVLELPPLVGRSKPGSKVPVAVIRNGERETFRVEVGLLPQLEQSMDSERQQKSEKGADRLGLRVEPLGPQLDTEQEPGVLVSVVDPRGVAAEVGVRPGDIITRLGDKTIETLDDYQDALADLPEDKPVAIRFVRDGQPVFRAMNLDE